MKGMLRLVGVAIPVVALAFGSWALAQEPAKPDVKPEPKMEEPKKEELHDIVMTAKDAKLNTLCELLKLAGLDKDLEGPGPFTVFAPTDAAFAKLGKNLDDLKKPENKEKLAKILKNHVVKGKHMAADVQKEKELKALAGDIKVEVKDGKVMLDGKIAVVKADVAAKNGVIHEIDGVIMPDKEEPKKPEAPAPKPGEKEEPKKP
jgi:uncharacterized surface protein with fasciclin (FAS1) repeats